MERDRGGHHREPKCRNSVLSSRLTFITDVGGKGKRSRASGRSELRVQRTVGPINQATEQPNLSTKKLYNLDKNSQRKKKYFQKKRFSKASIFANKHGALGTGHD